MSQEIFLLPDVGEGLVEAEIVTWKVREGDVVTLNQPLVDIETAKATVELPSPYAGTVTKLHGDVGDVMHVHEPLITFDVGTASGDATPATSQHTAIVASDTEAPAGEGREAVLVGYGVANEDGLATRTHRRRGVTSTPLATISSASTPVSTPPTSLAPRSTPPVRLYAKQHGVDIESLTGSGRDGLITRDDVERALRADAPQDVSVTASVGSRGALNTSRFVGRDIESWATGPAEERIPVKGVLRSMSEAMVQSAFSAPHAVVWMRVDASATMELVAGLKTRPHTQGLRLSPLVIVALGLCDAARNFPGINSSFDAAAGEVIVRRSVNLGIAADTPRGLIVPNIKGADALNLIDMAKALNVLVEKARQGTTTPNEMIGTTLTITNVGPFGVDAAMPILPPGTGAILAIGKIAKAPWVHDDEIVVRHVVELALAFDHRQIDGALASRVLAHVGNFLNNPGVYLLAG